MFDIRLENDEQLTIDLRDTSKRVTAAMVRGLNRGVSAGRTLMTQRISQDVALKSRDVREAISLLEATASYPVARIGAGLKRIKLIDFNAKGNLPSRGKGRGVRAKLPGGAGVYPQAFLAKMRSGHIGVFSRATELSKRSEPGAWGKNLPVYELHGPSLGRVFSKHRPEGLARVEEMFIKTFDHEMRFREAAGGVLEDAS